MTKREAIEEILLDSDRPGIFYDGFDDAIIGLSNRINLNDVVCYSYDKCIEILMKRDGMSFEEAVEYFEYNVVGGYHGEMTPIIIKEVEIIC